MTVVALCVTVTEDLLASEIEEVYLRLQTHLTFRLLPKELFLSSNVIHVTLLLLKKKKNHLYYIADLLPVSNRGELKFFPIQFRISAVIKYKAYLNHE